MFQKQKRNIRRRFEDDEDNSENQNCEDQELESFKVKPFKKKEKPKQTLLSFGEELEEADEGEVFKVKKSSRSKKLMKERRKKKDEEKMQTEVDFANTSNKQDTDLHIKTDDLVIKVKNSGPLILNGREALVAGKDSCSSEDEDNSVGHRFSRKTEREDNIKLFLESGCIPNAEMINAARKRRQKARELGSSEYIPVEEQKDEKGVNRLIREEDDDRSDEDSLNRIDMTVNTDAKDKEKRRQAFLDSQISQKSSGNESETEIVEEEWEAQQIRKGVTARVDPSTGCSIQPVILIAPPPPSIVPPDPTKMTEVSPEEILSKMRSRLIQLQEVHQRHESNYELLDQELKQSRKELEIGEKRAPEMAKRFRYYQELQGYVSDLVECLNEKLGVISELESRWLDLYKTHAANLIERRRQDIKDQTEESSMLAKSIRGPEDVARMRRATEREGRRLRRRRSREISAQLSNHKDGESSDDEITEQQKIIFKQKKEEIENESKEVFVDVVDDFCTIRGILSRLEDWRSTDIDSYSECFASLCIPKMLSPLIRLQLLTWMPVMETNFGELERTKWYSCLVTYALNINETEESLKRDPDVKLIPSTVENVVVPKLTTIVENIWDPMSNSQTLRLVGTISRLIRDYPTLNETSKHLQALFKAILQKMKDSIDNDVFIPIFSKLDPKHPFFQRQLTMSIKLLRNLLSWQGLIGDNELKNVAIGSLLNRYIIAGLRILSPSDAMSKADTIMKAFPRVWLQGDSSDHLRMFMTLTQQLRDQQT